MPRITPLDPSTATGETAAHLEPVREMLGGTPNLFTTTSHSSAALGALVSLFARSLKQMPSDLLAPPARRS
jgi:hypothetical protein